jgi:hypothetical protein
MRKIILHYHLFKNAGTSLDAAFKENFQEGEWVTKEFPGNPKENREQVAQWILDNPEAKVFSSHTAMLPPPQLEGIKVLPVIFMRHPIDRIVSAYEFEAKQGGESFGAVLARNTDLAGYIENRLAIQNDRQCRNFHTHKFAMMFPEIERSEYFRAVKALRFLPFIGIVEKFPKSISDLQVWLKGEGFAAINLRPMKKNPTKIRGKSLDERLEKLKAGMDADVYDKLIESNEDDIRLYSKYVCADK